LSELEFIVEHKAVSKIGRVDALSWHVGAVMGDGLPNKDVVLREQKKDSCSTQKPRNYSSRSEYFLDEYGVLYRRRPDHKHQLVVPEALLRDVIKANHNPVYVAHPGTKRTMYLISLGY
jgi:hypothetical protein